ncbi:hypothetical protein FRC19_004767 [Serendipita sp. 401]|nr:hypothetical protein FRC19_004767 [Serendipita sp. 401]KAG8826055.1 hypothetical protein FRC18_010143 [Serendipita sp. 400]KAG9054785.1 hypothetical protein FS842_004171 [Serendipita sp. 407]
MESTNSTIAVHPTFVPSVIILAPWGRWYVDGAPLQIGPWILGTCAELFLQGILVTQTASFLSYKDPRGQSKRFVWLVVILNMLCLIKTTQNIKIVWTTMITNYANPDSSLVLLGVEWSHYTTGFSTAVIAVYVQGFFVYRYYLLTKRWYLCIFMLLCMTVSLVAAVFVVYYMPKILHTTIRMWSLVHFVSAIVVDILITSCTAWHLQRRKSVIRSTAELIDRLTRLVWQTALPPAICVIINAVVLESRPIELTHMIFNLILPKLYAVSLLYTLNSRNDIRSEQDSAGTTGYNITASNRRGAILSGTTSFASVNAVSGGSMTSPEAGGDRPVLSGFEFDKEVGLELRMSASPLFE